MTRRSTSGARPAPRRAVRSFDPVAGFAHGLLGALTTLLLLAVAVPAAADPALYLSWRAPWGQPRATERVSVACGDTAKRDTLWLTFDPGKASEGFIGMTATVVIHAAAGDTLDPQWNFGEGQDLDRLHVEFNPDSIPGLERAWSTQGIGRAAYKRTTLRGTFRMIQAVPVENALPVYAGTRYPLARILIPRPIGRTPGCDRPVCIEWQVSTMAYAVKDEPQVRAGQRFVSWNSKDGSVCAPMRAFGAPAPWKPGGAKPPSPGGSKP